ncbi:MAG TPA: phenylalanine--tRNA ligase subunit alpha [Candidatus Methylomirabilis sp.]
MWGKLAQLREEALSAIRAACSMDDLDRVRIQYLGRKGFLTSLLRGVGALSMDLRPEVGKQANLLKAELDDQLQRRMEEIKAQDREQMERERKIDITLPGRPLTLGSVHPLTAVFQEIIEIFSHLGFEIAEGPEVELDYYNFEALNIPKDHPARDMQDTFYISDDLLLRTHTSPVQIRVMEKHQPPLRIIAPGRVYRRDDDISHTPMFHQVEGFLVDEGVSFADLKGVLEVFAQQAFDQETKVRFRPSFFPFTEPSAEVDIACIICKGSGCRLCSQTGWLEILGSGMIHPALLERVGYDPERWSGFAFGMGVERIAMLKYGIDDIRLFFENDLRFLQQLQGI